MIIRFKRKHFGLSDYLISGKKVGSEYSRDKKDKVISLYGDLNDFATAEKYTNENKNWKSGNYIHLTCGFSPKEMKLLNATPNKNEIYENIVKECISYYTTGYDLENEVIAYAEAHEPKIEHEPIKNDKGEIIGHKERLSHIHIGISLLNSMTNTQIRVPRFNQYCDDAFKTQLCKKYGLEIPKINPEREFLPYPARKTNFLQSIKEKREKLIEVLNDKYFKSANEVISWLEQDKWEYRIAHNSKHNYDYIKVKFIGEKGIKHWINLRGKNFKHLEIQKESAPITLENWRKKHYDAVAEIRKTHEARENAKPCAISYQNKVFFNRYQTKLKRDLKGYYIDTSKANQTHFKAQGIDILDKGDKLTAKGTNTSEQIALMLDIAIAKGWDLSEIKITGGELFRQEAEKQINQRIREQLQAELAQETQKKAVELNKIKRPMSALDSAINQHIENKPNIEKIKKYYVNGKGKAIIDKFIDSYEELKHLNKDNYQQLDNGKILNIATGNTKSSIIDFFTKEAKIPFQTALAWLDKGMQIMDIETELEQNETLNNQIAESDKTIAELEYQITECDKQIQAEKERQAQPQIPQNREVSHESSSAVNNNTQTPQESQGVENKPQSAAANTSNLDEKMAAIDKAIAETNAMGKNKDGETQQEAQEAFWSETEAVLGKNHRIYDNIDYPHAFRSDLDLEKAVELAQEAGKANLSYKILEKSNPKKYRILIADSSENVADLAKKVKEAYPKSNYHTKSLDELKEALETQNELEKITYRRR